MVIHRTSQNVLEGFRLSILQCELDFLILYFYVELSKVITEAKIGNI
jgi:hypothetical protein